MKDTRHKQPTTNLLSARTRNWNSMAYWWGQILNFNSISSVPILSFDTNTLGKGKWGSTDFSNITEHEPWAAWQQNFDKPMIKLMDWKAVVGPWSHCVQPASRAEQLAVVRAAALQAQNNGFFCVRAYKVQFQYMSLGFPCLAATGAAGGPPPLCPPLGGWLGTDCSPGVTHPACHALRCGGGCRVWAGEPLASCTFSIPAPQQSCESASVDTFGAIPCPSVSCL